MALFKGLTEGIGKAFENTIGQAVKLNQELGISSACSIRDGIPKLSTICYVLKIQYRTTKSTF